MLLEAAVRIQAVTAQICPKAPTGMQTHMDTITGNVKWGVLAFMTIAGLICLGSILAGRVFSHPHASRAGTMGLAIVLLVAVGYVTFGGILTGITGSGC